MLSQTISRVPRFETASTTPPLQQGFQATLLGSGVSLPKRVVTNAELIATYGLETSEEWIESRTGIRERRYAEDSEGVEDLAIEAALRALEAARVAPSEIDCIVVATCTSDWRIPSVACLVQAELGASHAVGWDVNAACSGFPFAFDSLLRYLHGRGGLGLVIGADCGHRLTDPRDRLTSVFFGDAAGALLISTEGEGRVLASELRTSGAVSPLHARVGSGMHMDGKAVWNFATEKLPQTVRSLCAAANVSPEDLRGVVAHQSNRNIIAQASREIGLPNAWWPVNLDRFGNTVAASIPLALDELVRSQALDEGDLIALVGYGGGLAWGGQLWSW